MTLPACAPLALLMIASSALACSNSSLPPAEPAGDASASDAGGAPSLVSLHVVASGTSPSATLAPTFSPRVHDYYVRCAAGTNALTVTMEASAGAESSVVSPSKSGSAPAQTVSLRVEENQAIVAVATSGAAKAEYWVRCLPHDFPTFEVSAHPENGTPPSGYYLIGAKQTTNTASYAILLDGRGVPVWYAADRAPLHNDLIDVDHVIDGGISFRPTPQAPFEVHHLSPVSTTYLSPNNTDLDSHELRYLSNGDFMVVSSGLATGVDLTGLNLPLADGGVEVLGPNSNIQTCNVVEFAPSGKVVWTWVGLDHLDPKDSRFPILSTMTAPDGNIVVDAFHCNSIDIDPENGNLLVSSRHLESIFYIERSTGTILWKMGGARYTKENAPYVSVKSEFHRQHDARLQPGWSSACGGAGQISLFDNETLEPGPARAVVYDVHVGMDDGDGGLVGCDGGAAGAATVAWQYKGQNTSAAMGSFRISADGSRVIGWGDYTDSVLAFTEVDIHGKDLLDFSLTGGPSSYRAVKFPLDTFDLEQLRNAVQVDQ